jgi:hypothetical protein
MNICGLILKIEILFLSGKQLEIPSHLCFTP